MNVLDRFLFDATPSACQDLLEACLSWVSWSLQKVTGPLPGGGKEGSAARKGQTEATAAVMRDLTRRVGEAAKAGQGGRGGKGRAHQVLARLTSGFLRGDEDEITRYNGFKSFVVALACHHLLRETEGPAQRKQVAECLLLALSVPVECISRAITDDKETRPADDEVLDRLAGPLVDRWTEQPPNEFGEAVGAAKKRGEWGTYDILRGRGRMREVLDIKMAQENDFERKKDYVLNEILDVLYPIACRVTMAAPNEDGGQLFLWLILGGVSHTKKSLERREATPHLVQPALLDALSARLGPNFVRDYRNLVGRLFSARECGYWDAAKSTAMRPPSERPTRCAFSRISR
jgi:hypothetical protein